VLEQVADNLRLQGKASEHDLIVSSKLAYVLTGGDCSPLDALTEQYLLDLEREAFLSLCGMPKTQARMEALLKTGKPLRN
jgi:3-hydroxyacyl-CoA dehydrogenase